MTSYLFFDGSVSDTIDSCLRAMEAFFMLSRVCFGAEDRIDGSRWEDSCATDIEIRSADAAVSSGRRVVICGRSRVVGIISRRGGVFAVVGGMRDLGIRRFSGMRDSKRGKGNYY